MLTIAILGVPIQAAFKKPSGGAEALSTAATLDWEQVKAEDKTLVEQVICACCLFQKLSHEPQQSVM